MSKIRTRVIELQNLAREISHYINESLESDNDNGIVGGLLMVENHVKDIAIEYEAILRAHRRGSL